MERPLPRTLGACADRLGQLQERRRAMERDIADIKAEEKRISDHLIAELPKADAMGIAGKTKRATVRTKDVPTVQDWSALHAYVRKKNEFSLLQRRVADAAVRERWEAGKKLPGIEPYRVVLVRLTDL